jgi:hypothetical protein
MAKQQHRFLAQTCRAEAKLQQIAESFPAMSSGACSKLHSPSFDQGSRSINPLSIFTWRLLFDKFTKHSMKLTLFLVNTMQDDLWIHGGML